MFTTGSKWFFGLGAISLVLAVAHGYSTGGSRLGPVTLGWYGAVGDILGYGVLVAAGAIAVVLGVFAIATRDADADALAQLVDTEQPPAELAPSRPAYWPVIGVFGLGLVAVGVAIDQVLVIAGLIVVALVLVEWTVLAWSDHATGDPDANQALRDRLMRPLEYPVAAVLFVAVFVFGLSRVFLTVTEVGAVVVASVFAGLALGVGALIAARPRLSSNVVAAVVVVAALGVVSAGVTSAARGERDFHEHHEDEPIRENRVRITPGVGIGGAPAADLDPDLDRDLDLTEESEADGAPDDADDADDGSLGEDEGQP